VGVSVGVKLLYLFVQLDISSNGVVTVKKFG
jgi:hypothetical protein